MKQSALLALCIVLFTGSTVSANEVPVVPTGVKPPDYEAKMALTWDSRKPLTTERRVLFHEGWTQAFDRDQKSLSITHASPEADVVLRIYGPDEDRFEGMSIKRADVSSDYFKIRRITATGRTETRAGETCEWYDVLRRPETETTGPGYLSCITADGIEVGEQVLYSSKKIMVETSLQALTRRPVTQREVAPKAKWFDVATWLGPMAAEEGKARSEHPDFVMTLQGDRGQLLIWKRRHPWNYQEMRELDGSRTIKLWDEGTKRGLYFSAAKGGSFQSLHAANPLDPTKPTGYFGYGMTPKAQDRRETVLGESCQWFDMTPGMMDASHHHCMTQDDIALKVANGSGWGHGSSFAAISLMRRLVTREEMLPPAEILEPRNWGFETVDGD